MSAQNEMTQFDTKLDQLFNTQNLCIFDDGDEAFFALESPSTEISQVAFSRKNKEWSKPKNIGKPVKYIAFQKCVDYLRLGT